MKKLTMLDGLNRYKQDSKEWQFTQDTELAAQTVRSLVLAQDDKPTPAALDAAYDLLIQIEKWKAMCLGDRMRNAQRNSKQDIWEAFRDALHAASDRDGILSIMRLKGFGSVVNDEYGQRPAKVASAPLRFFEPDSWGVVDWRTAAMLVYLERANGAVDEAVREAAKEKAEFWREAFKMINEDLACDYNQKYRAMRTANLSRTADLEMALFGLSLIAWPI
jgi:hypothetical protein